jgi:hypothetical protein
MHDEVILDVAGRGCASACRFRVANGAPVALGFTGDVIVYSHRLRNAFGKLSSPRAAVRTWHTLSGRRFEHIGIASGTCGHAAECNESRPSQDSRPTALTSAPCGGVGRSVVKGRGAQRFDNCIASIRSTERIRPERDGGARVNFRGAANPVASRKSQTASALQYPTSVRSPHFPCDAAATATGKWLPRTRWPR